MCQQCNDFGATIRIRYPHELEHIIKHLRSAIAEGRLAIVSGDPDWDDFVKCELQCVTVAPCLFCTAKPATAREANGREKIQPDWLGPSVCARVRVAAGRYPTGGRSPATPRLPIARYGFRRPDLVHRAGGPGALAPGFSKNPSGRTLSVAGTVGQDPHRGLPRGRLPRVNPRPWMLHDPPPTKGATVTIARMDPNLAKNPAERFGLPGELRPFQVQ